MYNENIKKYINVVGAREKNLKNVNVKIPKKEITIFTGLLDFIRNISEPKALTIVSAIINRLEHLVSIGLGYLSLSRETSTLSGGESQRIKKVRQLGSSLTKI